MTLAPAVFGLEGLAPGFADFFRPLHEEFAPRQRELAAERVRALERAHAGGLPEYPPVNAAAAGDWRIDLPEWCFDQRNQMTGPADDAELTVKMINSGAPGVMLDLEDSMADTWEHSVLGYDNIVNALYGKLTYEDRKRGQTVGIERRDTVIWNRVRGLHLNALVDTAILAYRVDLEQIPNQTLCIYIPKSESANEALWWRDLFAAISAAKGWPAEAIRCMALVESHPLAYEVEPFAYNLREYLLGLNLGRWDYMASLIDFNLADPRWVLPDRNTIPLDVPFFQAVRTMIPEVCHKHGILAIGGMTALYPSREDPVLNARAMMLLERDKKNEAACFMDGAWTGHPDQNEIALAQFPYPNQSGPPSRAWRRPARPAPGAGRRRNQDVTRNARCRPHRNSLSPWCPKR